MGAMWLLSAVLLLGQLPWLDALTEEADAPQWRSRWAAVRGLAARADGEDALAVRPLLLRDERPRVRAAVAWAAVLAPQAANATLLGLALKNDKSAEVRFGAAFALVHHRDRRAVDALVTALVREKDVRVRLRIIATLRSLTPAPCLLDADAWRVWWAKNRHNPRFEPADKPARRAEYKGVSLETRTFAIVPGDKKKKKGPPPEILVLPPFGWTTAFYGPYLQPLRAHANLTFAKLPSVQQLTGRTGYGTDVPLYPVDRLVHALDAFRAEQKIESFILFASGASGWIAMRYAQLYPKRSRALLLVDTALDRAAYVNALMRASARGDKGEKFTADTLMHKNRVPFNRRTLDLLQAYGVERGFHDRSSLELGHLYHFAREPQGFATVPDIRWGKHAVIEVPTLFCYSAASAFSGHREMMRITKHFPNAMVTPLSQARAMPFVESQEKFMEVVEAFLKKHVR